MSRRFIRWVAISSVAALLVGGAGVATADPTVPPPAETLLADLAPPEEAEAYSDDLPNPREANRRALRDRAVQDVIAGKRKVVTRNGSKIVELGSDQTNLPSPADARVRQGRTVRPASDEQYVELGRQSTDAVFVLLVDFGNQRDPGYPDTDTNPDIPGPQIFDGPAQNTIPAPDRRRDNTTIWRPDFSREYYQNLYFGSGSQSLKSYYERQSSGRYSIQGEVNDWVTVPYNQARYGRSNGPECNYNVCSNTWALVKDALAAWGAQQRAAGRTEAEIKATLARYDLWDRYDYDGDGDFNERDGYLDHLQIVHAGGDQAAADPYYGEDAIWSHRWKAYYTSAGSAGPYGNLDGGVQIGSTGIWAADYTMQAENAGMAVFAHEYGHDLGLPDHYDTADSGDNGVNWWSLMGQSRVKATEDVGVGTRAADLSAWDKLTLGWLNYTVAAAGQQGTIELGPHEYNSAKAQALIVALPNDVPAPATGSRQWWSGPRNGAATGLARILQLPAAAKATLRFQANYNIEDCPGEPCDGAYVEVDVGSGFRTLPGTITSGAGNRIAGLSNGWVPAEFDLSAYAGRTIALRFRYATNVADQGKSADRAPGLFIDDLVITADDSIVIADGAEKADKAWLLYGFSNVGAQGSPYRFYLASYRANLSYDRYLKSGPYHFGWSGSQPQKAEFFPYENGLLVSFWDTSYSDNNTSVHPGSGLILPIDARPALLRTPSGTAWRGRIQTYDAPFSLRRSEPLLLHDNGRWGRIRSQRAQSLFDDRRDYWNTEMPMVGVKTPKLGVTLQVTDLTRSEMSVRLGVSPGSPLAGR